MGSTGVAQTILLITGANQGIGLEIVKKLAREQPNFHIFIGSRKPSNGAKAAASITDTATNTSVSPLDIDINSDSSIAAAVNSVIKSHGRLDILFNNAAIWEMECTTREQWAHTFSTNVTSQHFVTKAFEPLLAKSSFPRLIFMSSSLGSMTLRLDPKDVSYNTLCGAYDISKAALNMLAVQLTREYQQKKWNVKVNIVNPGFRSTQLTRFTEYASKAEDGAVEPVRVLTEGEDGRRDVFTTDGGAEVPW